MCVRQAEPPLSHTHHLQRGWRCFAAAAATVIHGGSLLNAGLSTPGAKTDDRQENTASVRTLGQRVEGPDGGGVGGDADLLLGHGALDVHGERAVDVRVQVVHHAGGERDVHQASFTVVAARREEHMSGLPRLSSHAFNYQLLCVCAD